MAVYEVGPADRLVISGDVDFDGADVDLSDARFIFLQNEVDVFIVRNGRTPDQQEAGRNG